MKNECKKCSHIDTHHTKNGCEVENCDCKIFKSQSQITLELEKKQNIITLTNEEKGEPIKLTFEPKKNPIELRNEPKP